MEFYKIHNSIYTKIIIVLGVSYLVFMTLQMQTHRYIFKQHHFKKIQQSTNNLLKYAIEDIGEPIDTTVVKNIAKKLDIQIRVITPKYTYSTPVDMRALRPEKIINYGDKSLDIGFDNGLVANINKNGIKYQFIMERKEDSFDYVISIFRLMIGIYITVLLIVIYIALRFIFKPIDILHKGVKKISEGNLDYEIKSNRKDELGELIDSFNGMRTHIKKMIQAREQLLLDVSHELRSPLTRVNVSLELMDDSEDKKDIENDMKEMESMILELLESAKLQSEHGALELENINIIDLLNSVYYYYKNDLPGIHLNNIPSEINLNVDAERIKILMKNIISNALKYSDSKGKQVEISIDNKADFCSINIKDFGQGIPEDEIPFIFEPFYRVDKSRNKNTGGYGLGMNLCKKIMDAHKGNIDIESELGVGTTVTLRFNKN